MFVPRALRVRDLILAATAMAATPDVFPLILAYLRKRKLTKSVKALLAETSFVSVIFPTALFYRCLGFDLHQGFCMILGLPLLSFPAGFLHMFLT